MQKIEKYVRKPRRVLDKTNYTIPDASLSVRYLINRTAQGLPVNAKLTKHVPLPPDGMIADDYETGTEEITDVTEAVEFADIIRAKQEYIAKQQEEARKTAIEAPPTETE